MDETMNFNTTNEDNAESASRPGETKAEKFLRLAPPRVNKIIKAIDSLEKLSAHGSYEYTEEQVEKMFAAIKSELETCEASFKPKTAEKSEGFSF